MSHTPGPTVGARWQHCVRHSCIFRLWTGWCFEKYVPDSNMPSRLKPNNQAHHWVFRWKTWDRQSLATPLCFPIPSIHCYCPASDSLTGTSSSIQMVQGPTSPWWTACPTRDSVCVCAKSLQSCWTLRPHGLQSTRLLCPWDSLDKNTGVGCHALLQGIFPKQESNSSLLCLLCWQAGSLPLVPPGRESRKAPQGPWGKRAATLLWSPYPPQFPTHTHDLWNHKLAQAL